MSKSVTIDMIIKQIASEYDVKLENLQLTIDIMNALANESITRESYQVYMTKRCDGDTNKIDTAMYMWDSNPANAIRLIATKLLKTT